MRISTPQNVTLPVIPGERLAGEATPDERLEELSVTGGASEELTRFRFRGDEPGGGEQRGEPR